jgi:competence protein ComEC
MMFTRPPDIVVADFARFLAVRSPGGPYRAIAGHGEQIEASFLAEETGLDIVAWPQTATDGPLACAGELCRYTDHGRSVAIVTGAAALPIECGGVDAIVSQVPAGFRCRSVVPVIDRIDSWRLGAVALWLDDNGVTIESANGARGDRPWVPHPRARRRPPSHPY